LLNLFLFRLLQLIKPLFLYNCRTVTKKRTRQQTVTVENAFPSKDIENIFNRIQPVFFNLFFYRFFPIFQSPASENQMMELQRQVQMFFIQKEREWENKLAQVFYF